MTWTERQQQIIDKSIKIIARRGIQYLTIKHIAEAVGVSEPALYRHFASKLEILQAILQYFEDVSMRVKPQIECSDCSGLRKIEIFLTDRYSLFTAQPDLAKVLFNEELFMNEASLAQKILQIMHEHREMLTKALQQGQSEKKIRTDIGFNSLFQVIVGSMRLLVNRWCYSNLAFDLQAEGEKLWLDIQQMIRP